MLKLSSPSTIGKVAPAPPENEIAPTINAVLSSSNLRTSNDELEKNTYITRSNRNSSSLNNAPVSPRISTTDSPRSLSANLHFKFTNDVFEKETFQILYCC